MPGVMTFTKKDGTSITSQVKWLPEELKRMDSQQLIEVLEQTKLFALRFHDEYAYPLQELRKMPSEKTLSRRLFAWWALLCAASFPVVGVVIHDIGVGRIGVEVSIFPVLLLMTGVAIAQIHSTSRDLRTIRQVGGPEGIRRMRQKGEQFLASPEGCSAYVVWGEEYTDFIRHEGAIRALRSGWANTLEEAKRTGGCGDDYVETLKKYRRNKKKAMG